MFSVGNYEKGVIYNLTNGHNRGISDISWSPDGKYLASASDDTTIAIWSLPEDPNTIIEPCRKLTGHASYVYCVAFSPNGSILASGGFDDSLRLWDTRKGAIFKKLLPTAIQSLQSIFLIWRDDPPHRQLRRAHETLGHWKWSMSQNDRW